jgi:hypothetical protein
VLSFSIDLFVADDVYVFGGIKVYKAISVEIRGHILIHVSSNGSAFL